MLPFNLNIPQYSNQAVGTYSNVQPTSINNIPQFEGYKFDKQSGKYFKDTSDASRVKPMNVLGEMVYGGHNYGFTADQLSKMNKGSGSNDNFAPVNLPTYASPEHQYNA